MSMPLMIMKLCWLVQISKTWVPCNAKFQSTLEDHEIEFQRKITKRLSFGLGCLQRHNALYLGEVLNRFHNLEVRLVECVF